MPTLIVYASNSGSTLHTAKLIHDTLVDSGDDVVLKKAQNTSIKDVDGADLVLIGSPSWRVEGKEGQPHETIIELMAKLKDKDFSGKNFALFGCGDRSYLDFCGAVDVLEEFVEKVNGTKVTESLKVDGFYFKIKDNLDQVSSWASSLNSKIPVSSII